MKEFVVIKLYKFASPDVVFSTDDASDAHSYANILQRNDPEHQYAVYQLNEEP